MHSFLSEDKPHFCCCIITVLLRPATCWNYTCGQYLAKTVWI